MSREALKILMMRLITVCAPWIVVFGWNAGLWLTAKAVGGDFVWQLPAVATWIATAILAGLMLLSLALGSAYSWLAQSPRSAANQ